MLNVDEGAPPAKGAKSLYVQVLVAAVLGVALGLLKPSWGVAMKPLGDVFITSIKMLIAPIVFATVALGIGSMGDLKKAGRVGLKALVYFEVMTTFALLIGLGVVHLVKPGAGIHAHVDALDPRKLESAMAGHKPKGFVEHLVGIVPKSFVAAFSDSDILQVLFCAVLFGVALAQLKGRAQTVTTFIEQVSTVFFRIVAIVMRFAPIGAFGALAYTVGNHGVTAILSLGKLMLAFYATSLLFVFVVLGAVCRTQGLSIFRLLAYLKDELVIVLGTSSSESALPRLMDKLEGMGCGREVVRLVVPTGYSFNLDGTSIYLTMAAVFVAQALDLPLEPKDEALLLLVLLLTSKGAAAVTGGGFVTLSATLQSTGTIDPLGLTLLVGIDRFMSEARALVNLCGNAVATIVVSNWEGELDLAKAKGTLARKLPAGPVPDPEGAIES
jgi:aerobic C4-dicarboxylate transport protein